jgi:hypothetical protein
VQLRHLEKRRTPPSPPGSRSPPLWSIVWIAGCQMDTAIETARQDQPPVCAIDAQRKTRAAPPQGATRLNGCTAGKTEAAPIRRLCEVLGMDADSEQAILWLIALTVLGCDLLLDRCSFGTDVTALQEFPA